MRCGAEIFTDKENQILEIHYAQAQFVQRNFFEFMLKFYLPSYYVIEIYQYEIYQYNEKRILFVVQSI